MAHVRRKFVDVFKSQGSHVAEQAIQRIAQLYAVEKEARGSPPDRRVQLRQAKAKPILDDLEHWLQSELPGVSETLCMRVGPCEFHGSFVEPFWI